MKFFEAWHHATALGLGLGALTYGWWSGHGLNWLGAVRQIAIAYFLFTGLVLLKRYRAQKNQRIKSMK